MYTIWTVGIALAGAAMLAVATDGGRAFTAEAARRLDIARAPRPLPPAVLEDTMGNRLTTNGLRGKRWVVGFLYTQCGTVCPQLTRELAEVQKALAATPKGGDVHLLSVSFDPRRDTPARLAEYAMHFGADPSRWRFARIENPTELTEWLEIFGVVVIPDGNGGFEHNAALHVVSEHGELVAVHDLEDIEGAVERATGRPFEAAETNGDGPATAIQLAARRTTRDAAGSTTRPPLEVIEASP